LDQLLIVSVCLPTPQPKEPWKIWRSSGLLHDFQRFRLLEGHKGPLVADFLVLHAILPFDRLPGLEIWVVIRRKVSSSPEEPEWKF
jgi:hypothetical protein